MLSLTLIVRDFCDIEERKKYHVTKEETDGDGVDMKDKVNEVHAVGQNLINIHETQPESHLQ